MLTAAEITKLRTIKPGIRPVKVSRANKQWVVDVIAREQRKEFKRVKNYQSRLKELMSVLVCD